MARTTDDKKDFEVKLRINAATKTYLDVRSRASSVTVSEYIRRLIEKDKAEQQRVLALRAERRKALRDNW